MDKLEIAILLPCYNEELSIAETVRSFRRSCPHARIYVYDNNSSDMTAKVALQSGAIVRTETRQGKGAVVCRMFADIEADYYVLADGDLTYDATSAPIMIKTAAESNVDMVVGTRVHSDSGAYPPGHELGNRMLNLLLTGFFGRGFSDILSGYRVFSRRFVKSFPGFATGFEIETELSVHALRNRLPVCEVESLYIQRPAGSTSKLSTYKDGVRILSLMFNLLRQDRPLAFFSAFGGLFAGISVALALPLLQTFVQTGLVPRFPTAILSASLMILALLSIFTGLILDSVVRGRREMFRLAYLKLTLAVVETESEPESDGGGERNIQER